MKAPLRYMQNISRSKSFGIFILIVFLHGLARKSKFIESLPKKVSFISDFTETDLKNQNNFIAGLIGICVLIIIAILFCGRLVCNGLKDPTSTLGKISKSLKSSKNNNLASNSMSNLILEIHDENWRISTETATTSFWSHFFYPILF